MGQKNHHPFVARLFQLFGFFSNVFFCMWRKRLCSLEKMYFVNHRPYTQPSYQVHWLWFYLFSASLILWSPPFRRSICVQTSAGLDKCVKWIKYCSQSTFAVFFCVHVVTMSRCGSPKTRVISTRLRFSIGCGQNLYSNEWQCCLNHSRGTYADTQSS